MTEEQRCREHSDRIRDIEIRDAAREQDLQNLKGNHCELKDAFWKVEGNLKAEIKETAKETTALQMKIGVIQSLIFVLLAIGQAAAIQTIVSFLKRVQP